MKELEALFKSIADGLEAMAEGIHAIAKKVDDLAEGQAPEKSAKAKVSTKKKAGAPQRRHQRKPNRKAQSLYPQPIRSLRLSKGQKTAWITQRFIRRPVLIRNKCPVHCSG